MMTMFVNGFKPAAFRPIRKSLGQALTRTDRDHYLVALNRSIAEASEIDSWLEGNASAKLKPTAEEVTVSPDITISPYYAKWVNYKDVQSDQKAFRDRLASEDVSMWSSVTDAEHILFGWVAVVDQIYSAFKADPKNLTAGRWMGNVRQPDPLPSNGVVAKPEPVSILGLELPPTFLGMPTKAALIVGGIGILGMGVAIWATLKKKR